MRATARTARSLERLNSRPSVNSSSCTPICARLSTCTSSYVNAGRCNALKHIVSVTPPASLILLTSRVMGCCPGAMATPIVRAEVQPASLTGGVVHLNKLQAARTDDGTGNQVAIDDRLPQ